MDEISKVLEQQKLLIQKQSNLLELQNEENRQPLNFQLPASDGVKSLTTETLSFRTVPKDNGMMAT